MSAKRLGHSVVVSEKRYAGQLAVSREARTLEAAMQIEDVQLLEAVWLADLRLWRNDEPAQKELRAPRLAAHNYLASARDNERWGLRLPPAAGKQRAAAVRQLLQHTSEAQGFLAQLDAKRTGRVRQARGVEPSVTLVVANSLIQKVVLLGLGKWSDRDETEFAEWLNENRSSTDHEAIARHALQICGVPRVKAKNWVEAAARNG